MPSPHPTPCGCASIEATPGLLTVRNEDALGVARSLVRGEGLLVGLLRHGRVGGRGVGRPAGMRCCRTSWAAAELADGGDALLPDLVGAGLKSLFSRADRLESLARGHLADHSIRPTGAGIRHDEYFSI